MIDERTHRAIPLGVTLLIATLAALAALAVSGGPAAQAHGEPAVAAKGSVTGSEFALRQGMRSLWEDHVSWTRLAIISLTTGSPDTKATVAACSGTSPTSATRSSRTTARSRAPADASSCASTS